MKQYILIEFCRFYFVWNKASYCNFQIRVITFACQFQVFQKIRCMMLHHSAERQITENLSTESFCLFVIFQNISLHLFNSIRIYQTIQNLERKWSSALAYWLFSVSETPMRKWFLSKVSGSFSSIALAKQAYA